MALLKVDLLDQKNTPQNNKLLETTYRKVVTLEIAHQLIYNPC